MKHNLFSFESAFNNNIAILESKIIYFCSGSNFREWTTLNLIVVQINNFFNPPKIKFIKTNEKVI